MPSEALAFREVSFSYLDGFVLRGVSLALSPGEMTALVGPNGSGKTTLLKLASGVLKPSRGEVCLDGQTLRALPRPAVARRVAVVPQVFTLPFAFTVGETVLLGRTPHISLFSGVKEADREAARQAMALTGLLSLEDRPFNELSGGERQKVILALALAQEPDILLLDEPTAHLDIRHQGEILGTVGRLNQERGTTVLAALHDLNLAALYFRRIILIHGGQVLGDGPPQDVLTVENIARAFGARVQVTRHPQAGVPHVVLLP